MIAPNQNIEQIGQIDQQILLARQLQKHLKIYTNDEQNLEHQILTLQTTSNNLFQELQQLVAMIQRIKKSLAISNRNSELASQKDWQEIPQFVIKDVNTVVIKNQKDISSVANKLKVLVSKTMQKQSSKLKYNFNSYIYNVQEELNNFKFNAQPQEMKQQLKILRKTFKIVNLEEVILCKQHPVSSINSVIGDFYASFYVEQLLFFQDHPLPFNSNLLFVPLMLSKYQNKEIDKAVYIQILSFYMSELNRHNLNWENYCLEIIIKDMKKQTLQYYSLAVFRRSGADNQTIAMLKKIRCFVYISLVFNYMRHSLNFNGQSNSKGIKMQLNESLWIQINTERQYLDPKIIPNPSLTTLFLKYFDENLIKNRAQKNKTESTSNFISYILYAICLIKNVSSNQLANTSRKIKSKYIYVGDKRVKI